MTLSEWKNKHLAKTFKVTIYGNPITKKNSSRIIRKGNKNIIIPSKQYKDYEQIFITECMEAGIFNRLINYACNFEYKYFMETKRKVDLTNLISATDDCLQAAKVIKDDDCSIVHSHDGCRVFYDKQKPRVEISIEPIGEEEIVFPGADS